MDSPSSWLPPNGTRIAQIASFGELQNDGTDPSAAIPGKVTLADGQVLEGIDRVIIATGYLFALPFFSPKYYGDDVPREQANEKVLVTDGTMLHNLHKDIFYIPDPTLAFTGVPFYTATFSLFEFQAIAIAALFSRQAVLPSEAKMRAGYEERVREKGYGKPFHTLIGQDVHYVAELMKWVNSGREAFRKKTDGYTKEWVEARDEFIKQYFQAGSKENVV
jgi:Flavin-binding monooxygenase-like